MLYLRNFVYVCIFVYLYEHMRRYTYKTKKKKTDFPGTSLNKKSSNLLFQQT